MTGLADHLIALVLEALAQIEPDDRLVLGDDDPNRRGVGHQPPPIISSRSSSWRDFETTDLGDDLVAMTPHRVGVASGAAVFAVGERRLRHQRPQTRILGLIGEVGQLFVCDGEIAAQALQPIADLDQAAFDGGSVAGVRHGAAS